MRIAEPLALALVVMIAPLPAQRGDGKDSPDTVQKPPPAWMEIPAAPVRSTADALASFAVQPGYRVELVAAEPLVQDPIAVQFGPDGRLWVVEMRAFMLDVDGAGEEQPIGSIAVLTDTDRDGRMDHRTVFADGLVLPRALLLVEDGALVLTPPNFLFLRDTDGDGEADQREVLSETFGGGINNPEHAANSPTFGIDNWIYLARFHLRMRRLEGRWEWQRVAAGGQWGLSHDEHGRWFFNTNSDVLRAHPAPPHYAARNPALSRPVFVNQGTTRDQSVWPARVTPGVNRGYRKGTLRDDGRLARFTACCAPWIYRGSLMPELRGDAFVPEPAAHLLRRSLVEQRGHLFASKNAYDEQEFWTSTDERFRPVNCASGPDGALYVVDMYRGILQHRNFVTTYLRRQIIERELETPVHLGRIWRVVPAAVKHLREFDAVDLHSASTAELVAALQSDNGWHRDTAQRLLVEGGDRRARLMLRDLATGASNPVVRARAMWTLDGMGLLGRQTLLRGLRDADPFVRTQSVRMCERLLRGRVDGMLVAILRRVVRDEDPGVRLQLALTLGEVVASDERLRRHADQTMVDLVTRDAEDRFVRDAVLSGLGGREMQFLTVLARDGAWGVDGPGRREFLRGLAGCVFRGRDPHARAALIDHCANEEHGWRRRALLRGVVDALPKPGGKKVRVAGRPDGLATLGALNDEPIAKALRRLDESVDWAAAPVGRRVLAAADQELFEHGRALYARECTTCHMPDGRGLDGLAPPLSGSEWAVGSAERLVRIVLHGVEGPIEVDGRRYELPAMPDHGRLSNRDLAALLTFVRQSWSNDADPIAPVTVGTIRKAEAQRQKPWTAAELTGF